MGERRYKNLTYRVGVGLLKWLTRVQIDHRVSIRTVTQKSGMLKINMVWPKIATGVSKVHAGSYPNTEIPRPKNSYGVALQLPCDWWISNTKWSVIGCKASTKASAPLTKKHLFRIR